MSGTMSRHEPSHNKTSQRSGDGVHPRDGIDPGKKLSCEHGTTDDVCETCCEDRKRRRTQEIAKLNLMNRIWNGED